MSTPSRTNEFTLYGLAESGNCYKVALMLDLCGISWTPQAIDFFNHDERSRFAAQRNLLSEMPVLQHNEEVLSQTGVILLYLAELTGRFGGRDAREQREVLRWLFFDNHKFTSFYQLTRQEYGLKQLGNTASIQFVRQLALAALKTVEARLTDHRFVVGDVLTIADISMLGFIYYDEETGIDMALFPHIKRWKADVAAMPGWRHPYDCGMARGLDWSKGKHPVWPAH